MKRPEPLNLGFTGTQRGATRAQLLTLMRVLTFGPWKDPDRFHLGDCVGADDQAVHLAYALGLACVGHPPSNDVKRAFFAHYVVSYGIQLYLVRNREIVDVCDALIACPRLDTEEVRSGTWATIRYARRRRKPVIRILPNGTLIEETS